MGSPTKHTSGNAKSTAASKGKSLQARGNWKEQLEQMQLGLQVMQREAANILEKSNLTAEEMEAALSNANNFSAQDWQLIESARQRAQLFKEEMDAVLSGTKGLIKATEKPKRSTKPKGKKNWIPVE